MTMLWQVGTSLADAQAKCGVTEPPRPKPALHDVEELRHAWHEVTSTAPATARTRQSGSTSIRRRPPRCHDDQRQRPAPSRPAFTVPATVGVRIGSMSSGRRAVAHGEYVQDHAAGDVQQGVGFGKSEPDYDRNQLRRRRGGQRLLGRQRDFSPGAVPPIRPARSRSGPRAIAQRRAHRQADRQYHNLSATATFKVVQRTRVTPTRGIGHDDQGLRHRLASQHDRLVPVEQPRPAQCSARQFRTPPVRGCTFRPPSSAAAGAYRSGARAAA